MRYQFALTLTFVISASPLIFATQPNDLDKLKEKPIANGGGKVGDLLRQWWKDGTAAGNAGDFYDNRDGDHSPLNLAPYPQVSLFKYSEQDLKLKKNWAAAREIRPHVTFGNSSTSAPAHLGGSNPRSTYVSQFGLSLLYNQYTKNNLYIYPEHRDHDPGRNGKGPRGEEGYGDLYPTNTPYLLISQGSSGSDQPFMRMMPSVLAAFRPEVKAKLVETGTLMPTIQMLFRSTNKHLKDPKDYLTGKAHPTVFEGSWVDELALVQKAHALDVKALPPMVQLRVLEDDKATNGIDFVDIVPSEVLAYTPAVIARVHRTKAHKQRVVVSADASFDVNKAKLIYTWVVLRGDADKIKIVPKKEDSSTVEITVAHHDRRPVAPDSPMESNRVDIGVFIHNGTHYSAPGFVTILTLDREARTYDERGLPIEIAHGMGVTDLRVTDWGKLLHQLGADAAVMKLFKIADKEQAIFEHLAEVYQKRDKVAAEAQAELKKAEQSKNQKDIEAARKTLTEAQKSASDLLDRKIDPLNGTLRQIVESRMNQLVRDPSFAQTHQDWLKSARKSGNDGRVKAAWQKLARMGMANVNEALTPIVPGKSLADAKWTRYEKAMLEYLHATMLADLAFPGMVQVTFHTNYVDHRLSAPREWRDVYRHDAKGECLGWKRYGGDSVQEFNHEGLLVVEKDDKGRCKKARNVFYGQDPSKQKGINTNPLRATPGPFLVRYEFDGDNDLRGRRAGMEPATDPKK